MTTFVYDAARSDGATVRGRIDAATAADAASAVSRRGLFPVAVREAGRGGGWRRPPARSVATALRSLASLTGAGVPVGRALDGTVPAVTGRVREAVERVRDRVREGASLATALDAERETFPPVTVGLVRAGERGVGLEVALEHAADQLEAQADLAARLRGTLAYPAVLAAVGTVSVLVILLAIVPRFAGLLADVEGALPPATRVLLAASRLLRAHGVALALLAAGGFALMGFVVRARRDRWHAWLLALPVIGPIRLALGSSRASRALGALLATGAPMLAALAAAEAASGDRALARRLAEARRLVGEGRSLGGAVETTGALTPATRQYVRIGEASGRLPDLLERAARLDETLAQQRIAALVRALEPALIVAFAALVAFVAAALLQAVYAVRPGAM